MLQALVRALASFTALLMLLTFPAGSPHKYTVHVRADKVREGVERHIAIAEPSGCGAGELADTVARQLPATKTVLRPIVRPAENFHREAPVVPLVRLLRRFKLGLRSNSSDPLL